MNKEGICWKAPGNTSACVGFIPCLIFIAKISSSYNVLTTKAVSKWHLEFPDIPVQEFSIA